MSSHTIKRGMPPEDWQPETSITIIGRMKKNGSRFLTVFLLHNRVSGTPMHKSFPQGSEVDDQIK
jgi:hypothetical protein